MKRIVFTLVFVFVFASLVTPVGAIVEPTWPCQGSQNRQSEGEIDKTVYLDPSSMGSSNTTFGWVGGCPAVRLLSITPSYSKTYSVRIASDQVLGSFFISTEYDRVRVPCSRRILFV
jgi:hypothetical protein